jgi:hypothetical protein
MWRITVATLLLGTSLLAHAQQPPPQEVRVQWQLQVMLDGQQTDSFDGTTAVGLTRTDTHHHTVVHDVGCKNQPGGSIDLARTVSVSPLNAGPNGVTFAIDAQETLEDPASVRQTPEGCKLPPQPRQVNASHPGLLVPPDQWTTWQIVDKNPNLVYRVHAKVVSP